MAVFNLMDYMTDKRFLVWLENYNNDPMERYYPNWWKHLDPQLVKNMYDAYNEGHRNGLLDGLRYESK